MKVKKVFADWLQNNRRFITEQFEQRKINLQKSYDFSKLFEIVHEQAAPVFVLSTGRSGTALLTKIFGHHAGARVYHAPVPELVWYSGFAYNNYRDKPQEVAAAIDASRYDLIRNAFLLDLVFVETNNRITFFAHQLAELYPKGKFVHLVRNPLAFIKSGLARNWYSGGNIHDEGRIRHKDEIRWNTWKPEEKIAWLWNETNQFIEDFKQQTDSTRYITIKAEDLFRDAAVTNQIFRFSNLPGMSEQKIKELIKAPVNKGDRQKLQSSRFEITPELQKILELSKKYDYSV